MKDVNNFPDYAGNADNIQFLPEGSVHMIGAHGGSYRNGSNGRYDEKTGRMIPFKEDELTVPPVIELTNVVDKTSVEFVSKLAPEFGYGGTRREDYKYSKRVTHKGEKSV